jgi:GTP-binding protein Era
VGNAGNDPLSDCTETRSGYCALVGRSNVGKSTLLNRLVGARISSTAEKPQTTRAIIRGILTEHCAQIVFIDTPGIHFKETHLLNKAMNRAATSALSDSDIILFMVEHDRWGREEDHIMDLLAGARKPCLLCINKIDKLLDKKKLLPTMAELSQKFRFDALLPVSATEGDNLDELKAEIRRRLPRSSAYLFLEEQVSDADERTIVAELVREQLTRNLRDELPYSLYVEITSYEERDVLTSISAIIWVARDSHKRIVIGRSGAMLKKIGSRARASIEEFLDKRVHLSLWVKVKSDWQDDPRIVAALT